MAKAAMVTTTDAKIAGMRYLVQTLNSQSTIYLTEGIVREYIWEYALFRSKEKYGQGYDPKYNEGH